MKFGHVEPNSTQVAVDNTLLQGGIVSDTLSFYDALQCLHMPGGVVILISLLTCLDPDIRLLPWLSRGLPAGRVDC